MNTDLTSNELAARYQLLCRSTQVETAKTPQIQQIGGHLQALNQLLKHDLRALARRGSPDDFADIYFALEQELERFHEFCSFPALAQKFVVAFGGGFSAGKSSLINTLLGKRLLVTEVDPTTSLPTYLLKGEHDAVHAHNLFGHRIDLSTEEFLSLTHDEIERYGSNISRLLRSAFITRADFPWNNLALIDTPGYTKHEDQAQSARTDEHIARTQLNAAQAIVWVIDARKGCITEDDLQFLSTVQADIPRLIVVSRADQKPADEISAIVQGIKATLSERNLSFVDVIAVSARKRQEWPVEPILTQLAMWSQQPRALRFAHNFKAQFTGYASFIEEEQRQAQRHLNRLNRILVMAESQNVQADAEELKQQAEYSLVATKESAKELLELRHHFFSELKAIGDAVGIALPEPSEIDQFDTNQNRGLLKLLVKQREQEGRSIPDELQALRDLMNQGEETKLSSLIGNGLEAQLNPHIAAGLDAHSRETYVRLLAALLTAQGAVSDAQSQLFKALLGTLQLDDIRASLFAQTKSLDLKELGECLRIIDEHGLSKNYLVDSLILCRLEKPLDEFNIQLFLEIIDYLGIDKNGVLSVIPVASHILGLTQDNNLIQDEMIFFGAWGTLIPSIEVDKRIAISKSGCLPIGVQIKLSKDKEESVIISLAENELLNDHIQHELATTGTPNIHKALAKNSCLTNDLKNIFLSTDNDEIKEELARNRKLDLNIQTILAENSNWKIRCALAENKSIDATILSKIMKDDDVDVRVAAAENCNLQENEQNYFLNDKTTIRKALAANRSLFKSIQKVLMSDSSDEVRQVLASNPSIDEEVQEKLAGDYSNDVKNSLATNISLSASQQNQLFEQANINVKVKLFTNPSLDRNLKEKLISSVSDSDIEVQNLYLSTEEDRMKEKRQELEKASTASSKYDQNWDSIFYSHNKSRELSKTENDCRKIYREAQDKVKTRKETIDTIRQILAHSSL